MVHNRTLSLALAAFLFASCVSDGAKHPGYEDAARIARLSSQTPDGSRYYRLLRRTLGNDFADAVEECRRHEVDKRAAVLLFRLDADGRPLEKILYPASSLSTCIHEKLDFFPLPAPPESNYWIMFVANQRGVRL